MDLLWVCDPIKSLSFAQVLETVPAPLPSSAAASSLLDVKYAACIAHPSSSKVIPRNHVCDGFYIRPKF